jgi:hypothetical protein
MKPNTSLRLFVIVLHLFLNHFTTAQCLIPLTLEQRVLHSEVIVAGRIIGEESFWGDTEHHLIATAYKVELFQIFKGKNLSDTLEIIVGGGRIGDKIQTTIPSPQFKLSDFVLLMCASLPKKVLPNRPKSYHLTANVQSVITCNWDNEVATDTWESFPKFEKNLFPKIENWVGKPSVVVKNAPLSIRQQNTNITSRTKPIVRQITPNKFGGTDEGLVEIKGSGFGAQRGKGGILYELNHFLGGKGIFLDSFSKNILFWSDTLIQVQRKSAYDGHVGVLNNAGDSSNINLSMQITYRFLRLSDSTTRLANKNNNGGYTILYSTNCDNGGIDFSTHPARWAFEAAMGEWVKQTNFNMQIGGVIEKNIPPDNSCRVRFDTDGSSLQDYFLGGALGVSNIAARICSDKLAILENFDITFQRSGVKDPLKQISWDYCTTVKPANIADRVFSFRTIALHELGHGLGLDHVEEERRIMYGTAVKSVTGYLYEEDLEAARYIRQKSDQLTCEKPMNNDIVLPKVQPGCAETVKLDFFEGRFDPSVIVLNGRLGAGQNAVRIQVERSPNNRCFDSIGIITAKNLWLLFTDENIFDSNVWLYRLRFIQADGSFTFSQVISVTVLEREKKIQIFPNPFQAKLSLRLDFAYSDNLEAWLYDITGRVVRRLKAEQNGSNFLELDTKTLVSGMYILHLRTERSVIYKAKVCKIGD